MYFAFSLYVCGLLSGCARKNEVVTYEDTNREEATITYFGNKYEPENVRVIEEIISGFMSKTPGIHVSYESLKGAGYFDALRKRLSCGKGDDVFMVNHDMLPELEQNSQVANSGTKAFYRGICGACSGNDCGRDAGGYPAVYGSWYEWPCR